MPSSSMLNRDQKEFDGNNNLHQLESILEKGDGVHLLQLSASIVMYNDFNYVNRQERERKKDMVKMYCKTLCDWLIGKDGDEEDMDMDGEEESRKGKVVTGKKLSLLTTTSMKRKRTSSSSSSSSSSSFGNGSDGEKVDGKMAERIDNKRQHKTFYL